MTVASAIPAFCQGIQYFAEQLPEFEKYGKTPAIAQQTTESATQVSESFKELLETAQNLEANVGRFKVE